MSDEFAWLDATGQAELIRRGDTTPLELVDAAIARIEDLDPRLNAVIIPLYEKARAAAASPDLPDGPFRGVPFLLKDAVAHSAGDPYHCGMQVLKDAGWTEPADTWLVERFRAAGFVIAGKTNLPELATSVTTEPLAYGPTRNPWNPDHSAGGSSGGAGAAVASGMVAAAHGNDMGGSIRIPASVCGLVGLKPSRGRNTLGPDFGEYWAMTTHEHVLTRSVRDTAAVLDATAGPGVGDPYTAPPPARPFADEVGADPGRLRIGFRTTRRDGSESHPDCVAAVAATVALLESLGHDVEPVALPALDDHRFGESVGTMFGVFVLADLDALEPQARTRADTVRPRARQPGLRRGRTVGDRGSVRARRRAGAGVRAWRRAMVGRRAGTCWSRPSSRCRRCASASSHPRTSRRPTSRRSPR